MCDVSVFAAGLYRLRRQRDRVFRSLAFSDPSWDLLLELLVAEKTETPISVKTACLATAVPNTTAVRCLRELERQGVVYRERDREDRRRTNIRLSETSAKLLEQLVDDFSNSVGGSQYSFRQPKINTARPHKLPANLDGDCQANCLDRHSSNWCSDDPTRERKGTQMQQLNETEIETVAAGYDAGVTSAGLAILSGAAIAGAIVLAPETGGTSLLAATALAGSLGVHVTVAGLVM
jgi:DNA-binding MarR family transcriptional regulator